MRILVLSNLYPPAALGGYEQMCHDVVERFRRRGHEIDVLSSALGRLRLYWDGEDVVCRGLPRRAWLERDNQRALRRALRSFRPELVSVWGMGGLSLGLLSTIAKTGLPVVYVVGDDWLVFGRWADCWTRAVDEGSKWAELLARRRLPIAPDAIGRTGTFCFVSEFTRRRAEDDAGVELGDARIVPAGIETRDFPLLEPDERRWRWQLLCVGRVDPRKGFDIAIQALARLPAEATLTIVGPGVRHREELQRLAARLGVVQRIEWARLERSGLRAYYRAADALLFPSSEPEAFGLVPLEAMACATPVAATAVGGSAEYLAHGENCLVVPPADPDSIAGPVARLSKSSELRRALVQGGLATAARFTVDRQADELERIHVEAAGRRTPNRRD